MLICLLSLWPLLSCCRSRFAKVVFVQRRGNSVDQVDVPCLKGTEMLKGCVFGGTALSPFLCFTSCVTMGE